MDGQQLEANIKKGNGYHYDYPENREISKGLIAVDKSIIAEKTGMTYQYVGNWCQGKRKNAVIRALAIILAGFNNSERNLHMVEGWNKFNQDKCTAVDQYLKEIDSLPF